MAKSNDKSPTKAVVMRQKKPTSGSNIKVKQNRRISCHDLGNGDCEGFLYKKDAGKLRDRWNKYWFVLKDRDLYYYKDKMDDSYLGRFNLAKFKIAPFTSDRSHKFAFLAEHDVVGKFIFASDRQSDMAKWMNMLALASISAVSPSRLPAIDEEGCHSGESDDSDDDVTSLASGDSRDCQSSLVTPRVSPTQSMRSSADREEENDEVSQLLDKLKQSKLDLLGEARGVAVAEKRLSYFVDAATAVGAAIPAGRDVTKPVCADRQLREASCASQLLAKRRTLKDKEYELSAVDELLTSGQPINPAALLLFRQRHPSIVDKLRPDLTVAGTTQLRVASRHTLAIDGGGGCVGGGCQQQRHTVTSQ
jgi:hypothetical protein